MDAVEGEKKPIVLFLKLAFTNILASYLKSPIEAYNTFHFHLKNLDVIDGFIIPRDDGIR
jgi:hypothetical protein